MIELPTRYVPRTLCRITPFILGIMLLTCVHHLGSTMEIGLGHLSQTITDETRPLPGDTLHLAAPRGGHATGVIIAAGRSGATQVQARLDRAGLVHTQESGRNLNDQVQMLYGSRTVDFAQGAREDEDNQSPYYDTLIPRPQGRGAVQPIYVHITIPKDAAPGNYTGHITVSGQGASQRMQVKVAVSSFVLPSPQERRSWVDMLQSPDSVAYRYGVPLYSRQHMRLMRPAMQQMRNLGQQAMHVTAIAHTNFGNDEAMIAISDGTIDFSGFESYMQLFDEVIGAPRFVIVYVHDRGSNRGVPQWTPPRGRRQGTTAPVAASYGSEHRATWKATMEGIKQRMQAIGWDDSEVVLGWIGDERPFDEYLDLFSEVAPFARWVQFTHARGDPPPTQDGELRMHGMDVAYRIVPYHQHSFTRGVGHGRGGWNKPFLHVSSVRNLNNQYSEMKYWYTQVPHTVHDGGNNHGTSANFRGIARIGMDFWSVRLTDGEQGRLLKRFSSWNNLQRGTAPAITAPGPEGALPTARYLALWHGIQETEARILGEIALQENLNIEAFSRQDIDTLLDAWWELRSPDDLPGDLKKDFQILQQLFDCAGAVQEAMD